jgi:hypothetical protein
MDAKVPNVPAVQHERPAKPVTQPAKTATSAGPPEAQMVQELLFDGCVLPPRSILGQLVRATARATASWLLPALGLRRTPTNVGCLMVRAASGCDSVAPKVSRTALPRPCCERLASAGPSHRHSCAGLLVCRIGTHCTRCKRMREAHIAGLGPARVMTKVIAAARGALARAAPVATSALH